MQDGADRLTVWKRTMNGMMIQFLQQLNGQNFYYCERYTSRRSRCSPVFTQSCVRDTNHRQDYGPVFFEAAGTSLSSYCEWRAPRGCPSPL